MGLILNPSRNKIKYEFYRELHYLLRDCGQICMKVLKIWVYEKIIL